MTDAEISRRLALAIGWDEEQIETSAVCDSVILPSPDPGENYRVFDYRDPSVIWPIAERFNCFPRRNGLSNYWWPPQVVFGKDIGHMMHDTAAKAVALAVIKAHEGAKE